jgi:hypothetical protein
MAAGQGFKTFTTGDVLTAADTNGYLMQGVWVFASAAARTSAVTSPQEGNMSYLSDTNSVEYYSGSAWVAVGGSSGAVGVSLTKSAAQVIATSAQTAVTWDGEVFDTNTYHDNVTNNSRITIPSGKAGKYLITTTINYLNAGGTIRSLNIFKNGVGSNDIAVANNGASNCVVVHSVVMDLAVADYIQVFTLQNSGGNANVAATSGGSSTSCQVIYLGA